MYASESGREKVPVIFPAMYTLARKCTKQHVPVVSPGGMNTGSEQFGTPWELELHLMRLFLACGDILR